jgi:hypothetical protein
VSFGGETLHDPIRDWASTYFLVPRLDQLDGAGMPDEILRVTSRNRAVAISAAGAGATASQPKRSRAAVVPGRSLFVEAVA